MPVTCKLMDGAYRIVDKDGSIKHKHKHPTRAACMKQARAMNANMKLSDDSLVFLSPEDSSEFVELAGEENTFEKELIYEGTFKTKNQEFTVNKDSLSHWVSEHKKLQENGIQVPIPKEHTRDPEFNRGYLEDLSIKERADGKASLWGKIKFRDSDAAKMASSADVSIYSPPSFEDGKGNSYKRPIRHVALTNYPVIPGLDGFKPIAASLVTPNLKETNMAFKDLAESIGIELSEDVMADDTQVSEAIVASFKGLNDEIENLKEEIKKRPEPPSDPVKVSKAQVQMLRENRELKLSRLVDEGRITPAVRTKLEAIFCGEEALTLCLSEDYEDRFTEILAALSDNDVVLSYGDFSKVQALSYDLNNDEPNPLIADAERRAKAVSQN